MVSSEVQRTLVKSPPELWAEISDPESLSRHLGEFGEIRITRVQPEQKVEWEAADASGTVVIKPSGWGTKVKLTVTREFGEPEPPAEGTAVARVPASDCAEEEPEPILEPDPARVAEAAPEPIGTPMHDPAPEPEPSLEECPEAEDPTQGPTPNAAQDIASRETCEESSSQRGFFARLFRRRARHGVAVEPATAPAHLPATEHELCEPAMDSEPTAQSESTSAVEPEAEIVGDIDVEDGPRSSNAAGAPGAVELQTPPDSSGDAVGPEPTGPTPGSEDESSAPAERVPAEPKEEICVAEEAVAEQVTAVLNGVLDRLGAAHHRPFSRA